MTKEDLILEKLAELKSDVSALAENVAETATSVTELRTREEVLSPLLQERLTALESQVRKVDKDVESLKNTTSKGSLAAGLAGGGATAALAELGRRLLFGA